MVTFVATARHHQAGKAGLPIDLAADLPHAGCVYDSVSVS